MNLSILIAIFNQEELTLLKTKKYFKEGTEFFYPETIKDADDLLSKGIIDVIVLDLGFAQGAFADWLTLWHHPFVLIADYNEKERMEAVMQEETCSFIIRDPSLRHLDMLSMMVHKVSTMKEARDRHNRFVSVAERRYQDLLQAVPDIVYGLDPQGKFIYINDAIKEFGWKPELLIGRHFSDILHPHDVIKASRSTAIKSLEGQKTSAEHTPKLFDERRSGKRKTKNLEVRLRSPFLEKEFLYGEVTAWGEISSAGFDKQEEGYIGTVGIIRDVSLRRKNEEELKKSLVEKEILLKEIHHRVKNNLQVISSLINLRGDAIEDLHSKEIFKECQSQIQSIAMIHEQLYQNQDFSFVSMKSYLEALGDTMQEAWEHEFAIIDKTIEAEDIVLDIDQAIPMGLISCELISNSIKYGKSKDQVCRVILKLSEKDNIIRFEVRDQGSGFDSKAVQDRTSLGLELVNALVKQLRGKLTTYTDNGACTMIEFTKAKLKN